MERCKIDVLGLMNLLVAVHIRERIEELVEKMREFEEVKSWISHACVVQVSCDKIEKAFHLLIIIHYPDSVLAWELCPIYEHTWNS